MLLWGEGGGCWQGETERDLVWRKHLAGRWESRFCRLDGVKRFFLAPESWDNASPVLCEGESHHALHVMRLRVGDRLIVFDGCGREAEAVIDSVIYGLARLQVGGVRYQSAPGAEIVLVQALPRGKNMDLIIQKAVELGAARVCPVLSERSVIRLDDKEANQKLERWRQVALEACKQSGQNWLPRIDEVRRLESFFSGVELPDWRLIGSLQPDARPIKRVLREFVERRGRLPGGVAVFIGPEGDFTPAELALAKANGCQPVTLGPIVLRTETAALYCLSVLAHELFMGEGE